MKMVAMVLIHQLDRFSGEDWKSNLGKLIRCLAEYLRKYVIMVTHTPDCSSYWLVKPTKVDPPIIPDHSHLGIICYQQYRPRQDLLGSKRLTWRKKGIKQ